MNFDRQWMTVSATPEKEQVEDVATLDDLDNPVDLIVHNDDVNTFDWVITSLIDVCRHTQEQAEQCALLIHCQGQYCVKSGGRPELDPMREALTDRGIGATVEEQ